METGARAHLHEAMGKVKSGVLIAPEVQEAWEALKKSGGPGYVLTLWDKDNVRLKATALAGDWAEVCSQLEDSEVSFGAVAFTVEGGVRYMFFTWCGASVSPIKRGKVSLQKNAVYNVFEGVVCEVYVTEREGLAPEAIAASITRAIGKAGVTL